MKTLATALPSTYQNFDGNDASLQEYQTWDIIQTLPAAIYTCNAKGVITSYNQAAADLWGREPVIGKELWCGSWKIYHEDGSPMDLDSCPMAVTLKEKRAVCGEEIIIERPDGLRLNILPFPSPVFNAEGELSGAVNMLVDITERKASERRRIENEEKYESLSNDFETRVKEKLTDFREDYDRYSKMIEEVQDYAILMLDLDGNILNWNRGAERIKGYTEAEIIGKNFSVFYREEDKESKLPFQLIHEAAELGRAMHEGWRKRKDGTLFWGSVVITALHDDKNQTIGFSKVTRDLTERKIAEDHLRDYARDIELRNKELEEYAFIASHDLQEPLRKIQTFANLLEKNMHDKELIIKHIEKINSSAKRMSMLIKDVLSYSQLLDPSELFVDTDLGEVLGDVLEDLELLIEEKQARIILPDLPVIKAIPIQIHQLFCNLVSNSLKFTYADPVIEITCTTAEYKHPDLDPDKNYIKLSFKDNGIGFDQAFADKAFKLFQKLHSNISGTGIGLAICKKVVENHQGLIVASSQPDHGATFDIILPA